ncbi:MAG: biotin--[acetyl-CoA-carboxylase] ligase [Candidatus Hydrogenedens sp.]|nr:biotin--[acetyl-CoA-carboxylase] ligase [Candidatus Hydrogenedens sp.]
MPEQPLTLGPVHRLEATDSTNRLALEAQTDGAVFVALRQTAGRGRLGRTWESAPGLGLWMSVCLAGGPEGLTFAAALAVRDACAPDAALTVKWPNDLTHGGRKCCGMLVECRGGWCALGIGLNLNHKPEDFPPELRDTATSLRQIAGRPVDYDAVLDRLLMELGRQLGRLRGGGAQAVFLEWQAACGMIGQRIARGGVAGVVTAYAPDGTLLVRIDDGGEARVTDALT